MTESALPPSPPAPPPGGSPELTGTDPVQAGREALARHAWQEAYELLDRADRERGLSGADLESLGEAAFFAAHADREGDVRERAFKAYLAEGNPLRAASVAMDLAHRHTMAGRHSISSAWMRRGERLLEGEAESYAHGYLALIRGDRAREAGDITTALEEAEEAVRIATRTGHADLHATALLELGSLKIATGATSEGFELMEEATVAAVNGELTPITTGVTCCRMIAACRDLTDYQRASEWTEATDRWCERQSVSGFPGVCRVHRAEVVAVSGAWERAERELRQATQELAAYNAIPPMADGFYATGEIRRLRGDLAGAESAIREAHALGRSPQPALALIRLAEGKVKAAATAINSAVRDETWDQWARARLLPAQVEIAIASGDLALARAAAEELTRIVETYKSPAQEAGRHVVMGRLLLAEGDSPGAVQELRGAIRGWREVGAPYEVARGRALLAQALLAVDDSDDAELELQAARDEFERLGAMPDLAAAERDLRAVADREAAPVQTHKTFMFTDIVGSTNLAELLGNDSWSGSFDGTTMPCEPSSRRAGAKWSIRPGMASSSLSTRLAQESSAPSPSSGRSPITGATRDSRSRFGSACTLPKRIGGARITAGWACTWLLASPPSPEEERSWQRRTPWPRRVRSPRPSSARRRSRVSPRRSGWPP